MVERVGEEVFLKERIVGLFGGADLEDAGHEGGKNGAGLVADWTEGSRHL